MDLEAAAPPIDVLLVDANDARRSATHASLSAAGWRAHWVDDVAAAATALAIDPALLVLCFVSPRASDAVEAVERLAGVDVETRLIVVAEPSAEIDRRLLRRAGAAELMLASAEPPELAARIEPHLELARARRALRHEAARREEAEATVAAIRNGRSDFLAAIGHEVRTPMTAILGMSHLALRSGLNPRQQNYVEKVHRSAETLFQTLNDVLDYSNLDAGRLVLASVPFELDDVLDAVARRMAAVAESKGVELLFEVAADVPSAMRGDPDRLAQLLGGLTGHALRLGERGDVLLRVSLIDADAGSLRLGFAVRNGAATAPAQRRRLAASFTPSQADGATPDGAGLGVAISALLARMMDAVVDVDDSDHHGNTVRVTLRLLRAEACAAAPPEEDVAGVRALIADDNANARRVLAAMAAELGLDADIARDGFDAMRLATLARGAGRPYRVALLDAKMPGMDGAECARQLVAAEAPPPVVVMLSAADPGDASERLRSRPPAVRQVVRKPVTLRRLRAAVATALAPQPAPTPSDPTVDGDALVALQGRLRGVRLLLVEDEPVIQELVLELLRNAGIAVSLAKSGAEALERLNEQTFDGVLMDCQLPVLDGYETTRALRRIPRLRDLPVIALTASVTSGDNERVRSVGMNDHVAKPIDVPTLFGTLARWVRPPAPPTAEAAPKAVETDGGADALARLPGIDARVGRSSTMNNDKLYRRLLGMFREGQRDFAAQFDAARARGDASTATRLAHNLRSVSGSLGAIDLQRAASALERNCGHFYDATPIDAALASVLSELEPVMAGLEHLPPA